MAKKRKLKELEAIRSHKERLIRREEEKGSSLLERFREIVMQVGEWTGNVFDETEEAMWGWKKAHGYDVFSSFKDVEALMKEFSRAGRHEDVLNLARFHHAVHASLKASDFHILLDLAPEDLESNAKELLDAFSLGFDYAMGRACEFGKYPGNPFLRSFHSIVSAYIMSKHWKPIKSERQKLLEEVRAEAERYYQQGGKKPHHDVAGWFRTKPDYDDRYKEISLKKIRQVVGEVAESYGLKSGIKKTESS
jgi:hypothetical protein